MKTTFIFILNLMLAIDLYAQDITNQIDSVEVIQNFNNLYQFQNLYLSGQPTLEALRWLKSHGVNKIINLRTETENNEYSSYAYNEEGIVREMGFEYYSVPVNGIADYTPEKLGTFLALIDDNENVLIHCQGAGRATDFFVAYLIKGRGYSVNEAIEIGKNLKFSLPLERLLNNELSLELKN